MLLPSPLAAARQRSVPTSVGLDSHTVSVLTLLTATHAGNPSNQLAVLAQYAADPLSSVYHYYRALCVRSPFATAKANLRITFSKAVARWFAPDGGEPDGDDAERFKAAFIALHGIFFTKQQ